MNESVKSRFAEVVFNVPVEKTFSYEIPENVQCTIGTRVRAPFGGRSLTGYVISTGADRPPGDFELKAIEKNIDELPVFGPELLELARWVSGMYLCSLGEALAAMLPGARKESRIANEYVEDNDAAIRHDLSKAQQHAVEAISGTPEGMFYLYGVTGSGKTEVFLRVAEETMAKNQSVIYLVPEIALTHQLIKVLKGRFGDSLAVIHSQLTPSQKLVEWKKIMNGEAAFVVGARSAVFAPVKDLGLIIIDEEHESSYKSGSTPRYHARQIAMKRRAMRKARLVMGSATPSVEAYHLMNTGTITRFILPDRLSGGKMPDVSVINMKNEDGPISRSLAERIKTTCEAGRQVILFLNRRGFSYFFHCRSCGYEMTCRQCSVSMTFHKHPYKMVCHYCGFTTDPIEVCPECRSLDVGYSGFGTELIEEHVSGLFPHLVVKRVDTDVVRKKGALQSILDDFYSQKIDILLGTQMVAKGLNFPGVKLVGIVLADTGLHIPDFRSQERTFSLIVQVSGRAGRFLPDGEVIIQTYTPENVAVSRAARFEIEPFYEGELSVRKSLLFPPFGRLIRIVFRGKSKSRVANYAEYFSLVLGPSLQGKGDMLGPAECPLSVIAGNYRHHILVRSTDFSKAHSITGQTLKNTRRTTGVYVEIDVDPVSLL